MNEEKEAKENSKKNTNERNMNSNDLNVVKIANILYKKKNNKIIEKLTRRAINVVDIDILNDQQFIRETFTNI